MPWVCCVAHRAVLPLGYPLASSAGPAGTPAPAPRPARYAARYQSGLTGLTQSGLVQSGLVREGWFGAGWSEWAGSAWLTRLASTQNPRHAAVDVNPTRAPARHCLHTTQMYLPHPVRYIRCIQCVCVLHGGVLQFRRAARLTPRSSRSGTRGGSTPRCILFADSSAALALRRSISPLPSSSSSFSASC